MAVQAWSDTLAQRVTSSKRISLGLYTGCSLFIILIQVVRAALVYSVVPTAGWMLLPSLCCSGAWVALLWSFMRVNGANTLVPRRDKEDAASSSQAPAFDFTLWFLIRLEVLFWLGVVLLIVL